MCVHLNFLDDRQFHGRKRLSFVSVIFQELVSVSNGGFGTLRPMLKLIGHACGPKRYILHLDGASILQRQVCQC